MAFLKESLRLDFGAERPNLNLMIRQYVNSICSTIALTQSGLPRIAEDPGHYHSTGQQNPRSFGRGESAVLLISLPFICIPLGNRCC